MVGTSFAAQEIAGEQPAVAGDHLEFGVDQDRHVEAENPDAVGDLPDLLAGVPAGIPRIGLEEVDRAVDDLDPRVVAWQGRIRLHSERSFSVGADVSCCSA